MKPTILTDWRDVPAALRGASIALGNMDGVHRGHLAVLQAAHAAGPGAKLAALTFEPHPREHFRPDDPPFRLTLLPAKAAALGAAAPRWSMRCASTQRWRRCRRRPSSTRC